MILRMSKLNPPYILLGKVLSIQPLHILYFFVLFNSFSFCLDEISFRRDYKSCQVGVVVVVVVDVDVRAPFMETLRWDRLTFVILELHF